MSHLIPDDAFQLYVRLGPGRSYQQLADQLGVSKRGITKRAQREDWAARLEAIQGKAREREDDDLVDLVQEMNQRHLRTCKVIQAKALEALRSMPLTSAMNAVRALDLAIKQERLICGEPTERTASTVEDMIKREYSRWLVDDEDAEGAGLVGDAVEGVSDGSV